MHKLDNNSLDKIVGGTSITATIVNAFTNIIKVIMDAGRSVGSSIRRISDDKICPLE